MITRLWAPAATEVLLSGDWMGPQPAVPLVKDSNGVWTATVGPLVLVPGIRARIGKE